MKRRISLLLILFFGLFAARCECGPTEPSRREPPRSLTTQETLLVESDNLFGLNLFSAVNTAEEEGNNIFLSPLSVSMALGMTLNGADGETYTAMQETLELAGLTEEEINQAYQTLIELLTDLDPKVIFQIANSIWCRDIFPVRETFIDINREYFDAEVQALDFSAADAADIINAWVKDKTNGKIEEIVDSPIPPYVMMYLINAIYFKGAWTIQFDKDDTHDMPFRLHDGSYKNVPMMNLQDVKFPTYMGESYQAVDLAYGDSLYSMTIILPHEAVDIDELISELDQAMWEEITGQFHEYTFDQFTMPKFKLEYEIKLNDVLSALGMEVAFDPNLADFTRMYYAEQVTGNLFITNVKHKTFVEVNEEGTEAAAVTSVEMGFSSVGPIFIVNRPFIFAIRERCSGTILFIGKIVDPDP